MSKLVLASGSKARAAMLKNAGLDFEILPADIDEEILMKAALDKGLSPSKIAQLLADEKVAHVSNAHKDALVIGSDQILECSGEIFSKAKNKDEAREKLLQLRGKTHELTSAVSIAQNGKILWQHADKVALTMHNFSEEFLERYLEAAGDDVTSCVGAYAIEGAGINLFEKIDGDTFTILGMPLLPLLNELRTTHGVGL